MANVILDGVTYNGVDKVSLKDADNAGQRVEFVPTPTLITKNITANGTYNASSDNADGYSSVTVNVQQETVVEKDVNFYDYDGTLVASYTAADFANLTAMPANPTHTGLVAQGWNWSLSDAKTYVASYGKLNIGQMYATTSGKTEYDIEVNEATGFTATLSGTSGTEKDWGDGTTDTLETHTYATVGNYTIKLSGTSLPSIANSKKVISVRIASGVTNCSNYVVCRRLQFITMPSSVTGISGNTFNSCNSLKLVTIPSGVTNIYDNTFNSCNSLKLVTIPSGVLDIATSVFGGCSGLNSVTIPSSMTRIGTTAFMNCYPLQSITIPSSMSGIGSGAFSNCSWLTIVTVLATTPPTVASNSFPSNVKKIYIPNGTLATYQADTNWSTYASKLVELPA